MNKKIRLIVFSIIITCLLLFFPNIVLKSFCSKLKSNKRILFFIFNCSANKIEKILFPEQGSPIIVIILFSIFKLFFFIYF